MTQTSRRNFLKTTSMAAAAGAVAIHSPHALSASAAGSPASGDATDLQAYLDEALVRHKVPGASVAIYHRGRIQAAAAGIVNSTTNVPVDTKTVMHIGSITKVLNATVLMQLVDEGKVQLDAPVIKYLPEWKVGTPEATRTITVKMLLNHSSGIDGELLPDHGPDKERVEDAIPRLANLGQIHAPGKTASYCNTASLTAGYLIQRVRGESWYNVMKENLFQRLGLEHSVVLPEDALLHRATVGHFLDPASGEFTRTSHTFLPLSFAPAGATCMMSATDLVSFAAAHLKNGEGLNGSRILTADSARLMRVPTSTLQDFGMDMQFGLGWGLNPGNAIGHGGGGPGILSRLSAYPDKDYAIAVLTNAAHGGALISDIINTWNQRIAGVEPVASGPYPFIDEPVDTKRYVGSYENNSIRHEVVEHEGGIGFTSTPKYAFYDSVKLEAGPVVPLKPIAKDVFGYAAPGATNSPSGIAFVNPGADGRPVHIAMGARLYKRKG